MAPEEHGSMGTTNSLQGRGTGPGVGGEVQLLAGGQVVAVRAPADEKGAAVGEEHTSSVVARRGQGGDDGPGLGRQVEVLAGVQVVAAVTAAGDIDAGLLGHLGIAGCGITASFGRHGRVGGGPLARREHLHGVKIGIVSISTNSHNGCETKQTNKLITSTK